MATRRRANSDRRGPMATANHPWRALDVRIATVADPWRPVDGPIATVAGPWRPQITHGDRKSPMATVSREILSLSRLLIPRNGRHKSRTVAMARDWSPWLANGRYGSRLIAGPSCTPTSDQAFKTSGYAIDLVLGGGPWRRPRRIAADVGLVACRAGRRPGPRANSSRWRHRAVRALSRFRCGDVGRVVRALPSAASPDVPGVPPDVPGVPPATA